MAAGRPPPTFLPERPLAVRWIMRADHGRLPVSAGQRRSAPVTAAVVLAAPVAALTAALVAALTAAAAIALGAALGAPFVARAMVPPALAVLVLARWLAPRLLLARRLPLRRRLARSFPLRRLRCISCRGGSWRGGCR